MNRAFTLLQLSDSHLSADPGTRYRGQSPDNHLGALRPAIRALGPDGIVLSGDVAEDGSAEAYRRMAEYLDKLAPRLAWIPGNHDDRTVMQAVFEPAGLTAGPVLDWAGWQIVLLDSAWPDRPEGELDEQRLRPLDLLDGARPALVFVHHQPLSIGSPWIDKYPLINPERLWRRLAGSRVKAVACGHVHQVFAGERDAIACLSAPSSVANGRAKAERFTPSELGPAADGRWATGIIHASGA